jgi:hypothetical protein
VKEVLNYITDYMKQVIENGNSFGKRELFTLMGELTVETLDATVGKYI